MSRGLRAPLKFLLGRCFAFQEAARSSVVQNAAVTLRYRALWTIAVLSASAAMARPVVPLSVEISGSPSHPAASWSLKAGLREKEHWTAFLVAEQDLWLGLASSKLHLGVVNAALGVELRYFDQRVHSFLAVGTSTLLQRTPIDEAGQTGFYLNIRPVGLRFPLEHSGLVFIFDPLHFSMSAPVLTSVPLFVVTYKTSVALEFSL